MAQVMTRGMVKSNNKQWSFNGHWVRLICSQAPRLKKNKVKKKTKWEREIITILGIFGVGVLFIDYTEIG